ncbi:MAG: hypothetical protein IT327_10505 [Anaerolineae bacterium]|nr:hypothetical protein [Anaerolineae bacterium]
MEDQYKRIHEVVIEGSLEDFRALMHEIRETDSKNIREDVIYLHEEATSPSSPKNIGKWELTLGGSLQKRGYINARQLPNGKTKLLFYYSPKYLPIGEQFEENFFQTLMSQMEIASNVKTDNLPLSPSDILQGLQGFFLSEDAQDKLLLLKDAKAELIQKDYDNWNGGTYYYSLKIDVLPSKFRKFVDKPQELEQQILEKGQDLLRPYPNLSLSEVCLAPSLSEDSYKPTVEGKFIEIVNIPDDFYKKLIDEINQAYNFQLPISLSVLIRKLFENLIIDILRKKYGTEELELYYDPRRRRFQDFSVLLKNLEAKQPDFHHISTNLNQNFIIQLNWYRETGNSGAHSIDTDKVAMESYKDKKDEINRNIHFLVRVLQNIS